MAIDWKKVEEANDLVNKALTVRKQVADATATGFIDLMDNPDLRVPFTGQIKTFCENRQQQLFDDAKARLQGSGT
jgi:hypothetical protein